MSKRISNLFEGHNATRHAPHVTPTTEVYQTSKVVSHDRKVHHVPASQSTSYNVFPRTHEIQPETSISNAWQGSTAEVEFEIPKNLHLLNKVSLEFTCRITSTATADETRLRPGHLLLQETALVWEGSTEGVVSRGIDEYILYNATHERENFLRTQDDVGLSSETNRRLGITLGGSAITAAGQTAEHTFRIPIEAGPLGSSKIFAKGISSPMILRFRFAPTAVDANVSGTPTISLSGTPTLLIDEVQVDAQTERRLMNQYRSGISHRFLHLRSSQTPYNVSADQAISQTLSSHQGLCAGTLLFCTPQATTTDNSWKMLDFKDVEFFDETGTRFSIKMDTRFLLSQEAHKTGFPSAVNRTQTDLAFAYIPHCLHLASAFQGSVSGAFKYTSRERLDFTCSTEMGTTGAILVHVVTHCHAFMHVKNGIISFEKS